MERRYTMFLCFQLIASAQLGRRGSVIYGFSVFSVVSKKNYGRTLSEAVRHVVSVVCPRAVQSDYGTVGYAVVWFHVQGLVNWFYYTMLPASLRDDLMRVDSFNTATQPYLHSDHPATYITTTHNTIHVYRVHALC